jgi:uncharacterized small protein (DUF1192 family)
MAVGLLRHVDQSFSLSPGYYGLNTVFLLVAFMSLSRVKSIEALRYHAPGEWGKFVGLDRVPEVRTLRQKIADLAEQDKAGQWGAALCTDWMQAAPDDAAALYVDGHTRVYHGAKALLPRKYVARQKLCLRATSDYWVNAMDGQPFFVVRKDIDPKMIAVLESDIVPRLLDEVPNQPSVEELKANRLLRRFTIVFDREGYSPDFFKRMWEQRIACLTYRKNPGDDWSVDEFLLQDVTLVSGQTVTMRLAERGTFLGDKLWVREVRRLMPTGHQTSIVATDYSSDLRSLAASMFARWSQENFFKYMREHYAIDRLVQYGSEAIHDPEARVVNPEYRRLDSEVRRTRRLTNQKLTDFANLQLLGDIEPKKVTEFEAKKAALNDDIGRLQGELDKQRAARKEAPRHILLNELPEGERFTALRTSSKHLIDTIKMIAYRAETAMANALREHMHRKEDARSLLRAMYKAEADLVPDYDKKTLTVRLHHFANRCSDNAVRHLIDELNETETIFPDTDLRLVYELLS